MVNNALHQPSLLEVIMAVLTFLVLFGIGQITVATWDQRKKYQDLDLQTFSQFQERMGEFIELTKLWRAFHERKFHKRNEEKNKAWISQEPYQIELLERATAAESKVEVLIIKLVAERPLRKDNLNTLGLDDLSTLGLYRQGYQQLRESIDKGAYAEFGGYKNCRYKFFEALAAEVAGIITERKRPVKWLGRSKSISSDKAQVSRSEVLAIRSDDWKKEVENYRKNYNRDRETSDQCK